MKWREREREREREALALMQKNSPDPAEGHVFTSVAKAMESPKPKLEIP